MSCGQGKPSTLYISTYPDTPTPYVPPVRPFKRISTVNLLVRVMVGVRIQTVVPMLMLQSMNPKPTISEHKAPKIPCHVEDLPFRFRV